MGRGRGKGKKLRAVTSHEDLENDIEQPLPAYRRGRLQKPLKDDIGEDDAEKNEGGADDMKITVTSKELKGSTVQKGRKRKSSSQVKDKSDSVSEENGDELKPKTEESTGSNDSSCIVPKMKGASRHMHLISEKHLTEEIRQLNLRRCKATDSSAMVQQRRDFCGVIDPCSHGGRALVVKGAEKVENPEANSKYQDKAEG
ncbi:hypothetical protein B296_00042490 [Ensete ventricosum]|uniref:Uncharacterized protein n=1 Tax=Ensete ventricosum TaxID=4639 RepID=A0A426XKB2_ENSVE|nr:hypothetical protein B296_00042490 [Ensete ventricosum]